MRAVVRVDQARTSTGSLGRLREDGGLAGAKCRGDWDDKQEELTRVRREAHELEQ